MYLLIILITDVQHTCGFRWADHCSVQLATDFQHATDGWRRWRWWIAGWRKRFRSKSAADERSTIRVTTVRWWPERSDRRQPVFRICQPRLPFLAHTTRPGTVYVQLASSRLQPVKLLTFLFLFYHFFFFFWLVCLFVCLFFSSVCFRAITTIFFYKYMT